MCYFYIIFEIKSVRLLIESKSITMFKKYKKCLTLEIVIVVLLRVVSGIGIIATQAINEVLSREDSPSQQRMNISHDINLMFSIQQAVVDIFMFFQFYRLVIWYYNKVYKA